MSVYVVRHAKAGSRRKWEGPDDLRPLSRAGRGQAKALATWLATEQVTRVVSSPMVRCRETVEPLAEGLGLPVDLSDALIEGATLQESWTLLEKLSKESAVLCTHGDVMGDLVSRAQQLGVRVESDLLEKGSAWVFDFEGGAVVAVRYVPPLA